MPPRLRLKSLRQLAELRSSKTPSSLCLRCQYATAVDTTPATSAEQVTPVHVSRYSKLQPPSHRPPQQRKSQLLRSYVSLLHTTPLIVIFQHNNLKAMEWANIRRELATALAKVDANMHAEGKSADAIGPAIKLSIIRTTIFEPALRVAEFYKPTPPPPPPASATPTPGEQRPVPISSEKEDPALTHALSESAYKAVLGLKNTHALAPLLTGPLALLTFPSVSPQHVHAALRILAPQPGTKFAAPTRRETPGYWDPLVQDGLKKLMLLGARVDGAVFDSDGTRWVGAIDGGIDGLRAQLVTLLESFGVGLKATLEGAGKSLWVTMEGRRGMLDENGAKDGARGGKAGGADVTKEGMIDGV